MTKDINAYLASLTEEKRNRILSVRDRPFEYVNAYKEIGNFIQSSYSTINLDKIKKAMNDIENRFKYLSFGERWLTYNNQLRNVVLRFSGGPLLGGHFIGKTLEELIESFQKREMPPVPGISLIYDYFDMQDDISGFIYITFPEIDDIRTDELWKLIQEIYFDAYKNFDKPEYLNRGEFWLTFNMLSQMYLEDYIGK